MSMTAGPWNVTLFSVRFVHGTSLTLKGALGTRAVLTGIAVVVVAQFVFTYVPVFQQVFGSRPLSLGDGMVIVAVGVALLITVEVEKRLTALLGFRRARRRGHARIALPLRYVLGSDFGGELRTASWHALEEEVQG